MLVPLWWKKAKDVTLLSYGKSHALVRGRSQFAEKIKTTQREAKDSEKVRK